MSMWIEQMSGGSVNLVPATEGLVILTADTIGGAGNNIITGNIPVVITHFQPSAPCPQALTPYS